VNDSEAEIPATATAKERAEQHRRNPECAACHALFDPIGFAFESFDAIGRHRSSDGGKALDTQVELTGTRMDGRYAGAVELAAKLGGAEDVLGCVSRQWLRFALGREDTESDRPTLDAALTAMQGSGGDVRELVFSIVRSDAFRHQRVQ
jgi:hypothetical protein